MGGDLAELARDFLVTLMLVVMKRGCDGTIYCRTLVGRMRSGVAVEHFILLALFIISTCLPTSLFGAQPNFLVILS